MELNLEQVESSSTEVLEMVDTILGDKIQVLDNYMALVRKCFIENSQILDADLDKIVLQIPTYLYDIIEYNQVLEMKKGVAKEHATYARNDALLEATGTVSDKQAKADNTAAAHRIRELAYKTASSILQKKIDGAINIWEAAKKVQRRRQREAELTCMAGSAVGTF